jgi:hypothetical protein
MASSKRTSEHHSRVGMSSEIYDILCEYENMILQITNLQSRVPNAATLVICVFHDPILGRATGKQLFALELVFEGKNCKSMIIDPYFPHAEFFGGYTAYIGIPHLQANSNLPIINHLQQYLQTCGQGGGILQTRVAKGHLW